MPNAKTVLIVEDEALLGTNLRDFLARRGWDARLARTGSLAVQTVALFAPAVLLLDFQLPDMDGFQALDAIRHRHPACGCVLMTARPLELVAEGSRQRGISRILSKPFSLSAMEDSLLTEMAAAG